MTALEYREAPIQAPLSIERPLWQRRPGWLDEKIARDYDRAHRLNPGTSYSCNGVTPGYTFRFLADHTFDDLYVGADDLLAVLVDGHDQDPPLRVLDVGCGAGMFVATCRERGYAAQGLTACDYRTSPEHAEEVRLEPADYMIGDAHRLDNVSGVVGPYDLVITNQTIDKLVDPLSVLEQMAGKVALGGVLAIDGFRLAKMTSSDDWLPGQVLAPDVYRTLQDCGFDHLYTETESSVDNYYRSEYEWGDVEPIIMRRIAAMPVRFAVDHYYLPPDTGLLLPLPVAYVRRDMSRAAA